MVYANISYQLSFIVIQESMLFCFHFIEYWSSGKIMYNEGLTILCGFVLLFAFFLELLNMKKCFPVKKKIQASWMWEKVEKIIHFWGEKFGNIIWSILSAQNQEVKENNSQFIISSIIHDIAANFLNFGKLFYVFWALWSGNTKKLQDRVYQM